MESMSITPKRIHDESAPCNVPPVIQSPMHPHMLVVQSDGLVVAGVNRKPATKIVMNRNIDVNRRIKKKLIFFN
jgi:hypothetical protein